MINFRIIIFSKEHYPLNGQSLRTANSVNPPNLHKTLHFKALQTLQSISFVVQCLQHRAAGRAPDDSWPVEWLVGSLITPCTLLPVQQHGCTSTDNDLPGTRCKTSPWLLEQSAPVQAQRRGKPVASLAKNEPEVDTASWAEAQRAGSMAKAPSLSFKSATAWKKEVIQNTEKKSSGSYSCRGVCCEWALSMTQRFTCSREVQEVMATLEGI